MISSESLSDNHFEGVGAAVAPCFSEGIQQGLHKTNKVGWFPFKIHLQKHCSLPFPESGGLDWHPLAAAARERDNQNSAGMLLQDTGMGAVGL